MPSPRISVIVSCFNEQDCIGATLEDLADHLSSDCEVLVVDGGSDGSAAVVRSFQGKVPGLRLIPHPDDRGKGHAIRTGMREARGRVQAQFDADGQFFAEDLDALCAPILAGQADVCLGSRFLKTSGRDAEAPWTRNLGNFCVSGWTSLIHGRRMTDVMAGIKAWSAEYARRVTLRSDRFEYEVEIPCRALRLGMRVQEVPVRTRARQGGESKVPLLRTGLRVLVAALRFRCQR